MSSIIGIGKRVLTGAAMAAVLVTAGTAGATDDPMDLSPANRALFIHPHLQSIEEPTVLIYDFEKKGTLEDGFVDIIKEEVMKVHPDGRKDLSFQFLNGTKNVNFRDFLSQTRNPIFALFLERDVREMERLTKGNALYFRNRIKHALAGSAEMEDVTIALKDRSIEATVIRITPYIDDPLNDRYPRYKKKSYEFILSDEIPGGFYKVTASTPDPLNEEPLTYDSMTFLELRAPEVKKAQSDGTAE